MRTLAPSDPDSVARAMLERYGALIRRIVARVGGRAVSSSAEDVTQTVALSLWKQISREQTITHPSSYIYRAAIRETVRAVKAELARNRDHVSIDGEAPPHLAGPGPDPEASAAAAQVGVDIEKSIATLSPDRAKAVRAHLSGYTVEEIMRVYDWPYQKARNLISRAMADLRADLRKRGHGG